MSMFGFVGGAVAVTVVVPLQSVTPDSTIAAGGWTDQVGGTANIHGPLADNLTSTWGQSPANPVSATLKLGLANLNVPGPGTIRIMIDAEQV